MLEADGVFLLNCGLIVYSIFEDTKNMPPSKCFVIKIKWLKCISIFIKSVPSV